MKGLKGFAGVDGMNGLIGSKVECISVQLWCVYVVYIMFFVG